MSDGLSITHVLQHTAPKHVKNTFELKAYSTSMAIRGMHIYDGGPLQLNTASPAYSSSQVWPVAKPCRTGPGQGKAGERGEACCTRIADVP